MKKIILLSDGTGNSAAKRHKTNVWRLYSALDLQHGDQIAMYDDGVGSQEFLPFKLLGGAFGWGLKRNVIELYKFLCRNYSTGDKIYLFGFSRGAFTVRVLAGLIDKCGLCADCKSECDLHEKARKNFAIYREGYRGLQIANLFAFRKKDRSHLAAAVYPEIEFIGVWDTVDAYGLPIDELADLWNRFIYPMRFRDHRLSDRVLKACHAISIDDERHTFHPVLWDEDSDRIEQVWFPGVHSDVGGGYPHIGLSLVSLDWMISKVETRNDNQSGLTFLSDLREEYRRRCDWNGIQHDSRAGLAAFYRYMPRNIEHLYLNFDASATGNKKRFPKIHRSVFERIQNEVVPYAPTGLPERYDIVTTRGKAPIFESDEEKRARYSAMNRALDVIYWRRRLYKAFLATTLILIASPALLEWKADASCINHACLLDSVCGAVKNILPDFTAYWINALCQNPAWLASLAFSYVVLVALKKYAAVETYERAAAAWSSVKGATRPSEWSPTVTQKLRNISISPVGKRIRQTWWKIVFVLILLVIAAALFRYFDSIHCLAGCL